jgi:hypothetical protein
MRVDLCLTYTGTSQLSGLMKIYSDADNYVTPLYTNVPLSSLMNNCPYSITVPNNAHNVKIMDMTYTCFAIVPVNNNNLCVTCNLNFTSTTNSVAALSAGLITGSCSNNITDYYIEWYGPDSTSTLYTTSGYGTAFTPYTLTHPFSSALAVGGTYYPKLKKLKFDGRVFTSSGSTGQILANIDCLPSTTIQNYLCSNGTNSPLADYSHSVSFTNTSAGNSQGLTARFIFTGNTDYMAIMFEGQSVYDTFKITFYGSAYGNNPVVVENMSIGYDTNVYEDLPTSIPRKFALYRIKKIVDLRKLTKNLNDYLVFEVIPNPTNNQTNWKLDFKCLNTSNFNCTRCLDTYLNTSMKISKSSISRTFDNCGNAIFTFKVGACGDQSTDLVNKYLSYNYGDVYNDTGSTGKTLTNSYNPLYLSRIRCNFEYLTYENYTCITNVARKIILNKTSGGPLTITCSSVDDFNAYYNSFMTNCYSQRGYTNLYDIRYYRYTSFQQPYSTTNSYANCGDGVSNLYLYFHPNTVQYTTGRTGTDYTLTINQPLISVVQPFFPCDFDCNDNIQTISNLTDYTYHSAINATSFVGLRSSVPFYSCAQLNSGTSVNSSATFNGYDGFINYSNLTYPYSGTSTVLPLLSGKTCTNIVPNANSISYYYKYSFDFILTNPSNYNDFKINARPITNGLTGTPVLVYNYAGGVVTYVDNNYFLP